MVQANNYWSSSTNANNTNNAWNVNMNNGNVNNNNKTNNNYVWPVRGGEWCPPTSAPAPPATGASGAVSKLFKGLHASYLNCRKHKRNTINALAFEINAEENLYTLAEELAAGNYTPRRSVCFVVERPKLREIVAADFRDRVVHHYLVERMTKVFEPVFIHDSYACRDNKGVHAALTRVREFIRSGSANGRQPLYYLHLDIKNFFMTIHRETLYRQLERRVRRDRPQGGGFLLKLAHKVIFHNPVQHCVIKGDRELFRHLPPHKSLFQAEAGRGLPVGNLTSQFFANVYLNDLDQFCKHILKCRYYVRYCDDFLILDNDPRRLEELRELTRAFLADNLRLTLNERYAAIQPVQNGIDFLGYIIKQSHVLVRRRAVNNLRQKLDRFEKLLVNGGETAKTIFRHDHGGRVGKDLPCPPIGVPRGHDESMRTLLDLEKLLVNGGETTKTIFRHDQPTLDKLRATIASYLGHFKWADSNRLRRAICKRYSFIDAFFDRDDAGKLTPRCPIPRQEFRTVRQQYAWLASRFPDSVMFFQVGRHYEFYGDEKPPVRCHRRPSNRRKVRYAFPASWERGKIREALRTAREVVIVRETGGRLGRLKVRRVERMIRNE